MSQSIVPPILLLDTCVLINLLASGEAEGILRSTGKECKICAAVKNETLYLRSEDLQEQDFEPIHPESLIQSRLLSICEIEADQEAVLYVDYASMLDDGEAMSLAIAEARGWILATDDHKARRIFLESINASKRLTSTSELLRQWSESESVLPAKLKTVLMNIQHKASFVPSRKDTNFAWWKKSCG